jgi:hypothetical protein
MVRAIRRTALVGLAALSLAVGLASCGTSLSPNQRDGALPGEPSFTQFRDIPIPSSTSLNKDRSLITGAQDSWIGRLVFTSFDNTTEMFDFYKNNAPGFGWEEITSVRSKISVLTYARGDRVMTVQIADRWFWGSEVELTVSPRGTPGGGMNGGGGGLPPIGRAPSIPVQRGP